MDEYNEENGEGEMVPAAGRINEKGQVIDDDGNPIGKVTQGDASQFNGFIVTQEGDILDEDGGVVGKAQPLEDQGKSGGLGGALGGIGKTASGAVRGLGRGASGATGAVGDTAKGATDTVGKATGTQKITGQVGNAAKGATDAAGQATEGATGAAGKAVGDAASDVQEWGDRAALNYKDIDFRDMVKRLPAVPSLSPSIAEKVLGMFEGPFTVADGGKVTDQSGHVIGKLASGSDIQDLIGKEVQGIDGEGNLIGENDDVIGKVDIAPEGSIAQRIKEEVPEAAERLNALEKARRGGIQIPSFAPSVADRVINMFEGPFNINESGQVTDQNGKILGRLARGQDYEHLLGKDIKGIDGQGNLLGDNETVLGKVDLVPEGTVVDRIRDEVPEAGERLDAIEAAKEQAEQAKLPDISTLKGMKINKSGNVVDDKGNPMGKVKSGDIKKMVGRSPDAQGRVWDDSGNVIGEVEALPESVQNIPAPFEDFPDATVDKFGKVIFDGRQVGVVVGDDWQNLIGKKVDADGDILDKNGNVIGKAERAEAEEEEFEEDAIDYSCLRDKKVNKMGNVVDDKGQVWGHVVQGILKHLVGKKVGENGEIFNDAGQVIGKAEPIPENEREDVKEPSPFEDFPDAVVGEEGKVMSNGEQVGILVEGDPKKLQGKPVDPDGDILDKNGNQLGRAERWYPEEKPEVDMSVLAGKRINKAGNAVDKHGDIYGRVIEGALSRLVGKMCDKNGFIRNEAGDVIGKCELVPEAEREGMKEGPFSELEGCTVTKEGMVVTPNGEVVGRLVEGDPKALAGRPVDDDGDICDKNGNVIGRAERYEEPEPEKEVNPMSGRKVNQEGNVVDENGDLMGKLTSGELSECAGKTIDDDGDVVDQKGNRLGHCSLLSEIQPPKDIPEEEEPEPEETEEEREARLAREKDAKVAGQIAYCLEQSLDKIKPILRMIWEKIDAEERKPEEERDEEELVKQVRPLIEEGGKILTEANGVIRGLDPDGHVAANAKARAGTHEATPEEHHCAELLKELTGEVTETIERAKRKLENMPKAKKQINPLWGLLAEPLFQIIAGVGMLLAGVLGLVGKLLNGLGLGSLVNNLLGGLGLGKILDGLGLGQALGLGGGKKK
ncbi:hypothetical protein F4780DRAFT_771389 [Xylariomycetidae sp. FL0641]|nr:hypothetical protein F4780DRAFT_771389 [Xylariomycetidae sp. FL0641]